MFLRRSGCGLKRHALQPLAIVDALRMMRIARHCKGTIKVIRNYLFLLLFLASTLTQAQTPRVVDVPTRTGVTQRFLLLQPEQAQQTKAAVILFAGGDGGVQLAADGAISGLHQYATHAR